MKTESHTFISFYGDLYLASRFPVSSIPLLFEFHNPTRELVSGLPLLINALLWALLVVLIIY